jgi:RimJ/RimL family protein N-acetyltransferase
MTILSTRIHVREFDVSDIEEWADYWEMLTDDTLVGMGVDLAKMPDRSGFVQMIKGQLDLPVEKRRSYALIWELDGTRVGHTNVNDIQYGIQANMHLHLWYPLNRGQGYGTELLRRSIPFYFEKLKLKKLYCEPYAENPAPQKALVRVGFELIKRYRTIPGSINFEQEVNQYRMTRTTYEKIYRNTN